MISIILGPIVGADKADCNAWASGRMLTNGRSHAMAKGASFKGVGSQPITSAPISRMAEAISPKPALFQTIQMIGRPSSTDVRNSPGLNCSPPSPIRQITGLPEPIAAPMAAPGA